MKTAVFVCLLTDTQSYYHEETEAPKPHMQNKTYITHTNKHTHIYMKNTVNNTYEYRNKTSKVHYRKKKKKLFTQWSILRAV